MDSSSSFLLGSSAFGYPVQYVSVIVAVIACGAVYRWRRRDLPGPMPWPIFGTALEHILNQNRMHDWLLTYFEKGSTISAPMPLGSWYYYTVDPTNIEYILKTNFSNFPKGETFHYRMEELLGDGIFNSDGDTWRAQRKTAAAEFSLRSLRNFSADIFQEKGRKLAGLVSQIAYDGNSVDMQDLFLRMTLDSIGKVAFGVEIGSLSSQFPLPQNEFATAFDLANEIVTRRFINPLWRLERFLKISLEAKMTQCIRVLDEFTYNVIAKRKLEVQIAKTLNLENARVLQPKPDIISRFLDLGETTHYCGHMTDKTLRDVVLNFVIAGRDTTAVTLSWCVYMLTQHPEIANRLYEELRDFEQTKMKSSSVEINGEHNAEIYHKTMTRRIHVFTELLTYDSLKELTFLRAVISETLRLYPAVPLDPKGIVNDDLLPDGTHLKKGNLIAYSPYCMARMTSIWGPDAKTFNPDRWLRAGKFVPQSEFKFATFQAGLRMCLGKDSAYLQLKITTAILCRFFEFTRATNGEVRYRMMATLLIDHGFEVFARLRD